jgi:hypothetical protein
LCGAERRLEQERGSEVALAALLGAIVFAIDAQQEPGAPAALRAMLAPAASVAAAILAHAQAEKAPPRLALAGLMAALAAMLQECSRKDLAAFTADLATAEAGLRCAVAAGAAAAARGSAPQRSALWADLLPACFKTIRKLGACLCREWQHPAAARSRSGRRRSAGGRDSPARRLAARPCLSPPAPPNTAVGFSRIHRQCPHRLVAAAAAPLPCPTACSSLGLPPAAAAPASLTARSHPSSPAAIHPSFPPPDDMDEHALLEGERWAFVRACGSLLGLALSATENLRLDVSLSDALAPLDRQEVAQGAVTLAHQLGW